MLADVLERVKHDYVNPVDDHQLLQAAIRGMVSSLDPYSAYLDGDEYDEIKISSSGQYSGVGIEVSMEDDQVVVVSPFEGSPAAAAGIRAGDVIATIDGAPLKGLVLDLRNNPGGVLEAAVSVADAFLDAGLIVSAKGRTAESKFEMNATPGDELNGAPIVVLVNGGSASAAEIVAGALKDHHRAKLMGRTTFGKGSVQTVMPLSGDRAIKLTTSLYYTPSGISINHRGITPDIELAREPDEPSSTAPAPADPALPLEQRDPDVRRAIQELKIPTVGGAGSVTA